MKSDSSDGRLKVFLVEDSIPIRKRMAAMLEAIKGVQVVGEAEEPLEALDEIAAQPVDVVIIDLRLTASTGMDVLAGLSQSGRPITTIVLTNHSNASFREACMAVGAHYFFDKTSEFELARDTIERIARERVAGATE